MAATPQKWTLKIEFDGEVRRLRDWPESGEPNVQTLRAAISGLFELDPSQQEALRVTYQDDEGDVCTVVEASLPDVLSFATRRGVLRLAASCGPKPAATWIVVGEDLQAKVEMPCPSSPCSPGEAPPAAEIVVEEDLQVEVEASTPQVVDEAAQEIEDVPQQAEAQENQTEDVPRQAESEASQTSGSTQPSSPTANASRVFEEVSRDVGDRLSESHRLVTERLDNARPHVGAGFAFFKQQVVDDFQSTSKDMKDAFGPNQTQCQALGLVRGAVGAAAGILAAARLAPIRATRLAAHSAAAVAGRDVTSIATEPPADRESVAEDGSVTELDRLKQQVKNDFLSTQKDVSTAFSCLLGQNEVGISRATEGAALNEPNVEHDNSQPQQQQQPPRDNTIRVKNAVSAVVGVSAVLCLLPIRGTRFAVANIAHAVSPNTNGQSPTVVAPNTNGQEEAPEQEPIRQETISSDEVSGA